MEEPAPTAIYAQVNMALKRKNRRNSTSRGDSGEDSGRKRPVPPQRPPPTPPTAYTSKKATPPPVAPKKPSLQSHEGSSSRTSPEHNNITSSSSPTKIPLLPKPPAIPKKASQVLAEKKRKIVPPKPIPYHIYIKAKEKRLLNASGPERRGEDKENRPDSYGRDTDSDGSNDS